MDTNAAMHSSQPRPALGQVLDAAFRDADLIAEIRQLLLKHKVRLLELLAKPPTEECLESGLQSTAR